MTETRPLSEQEEQAGRKHEPLTVNARAVVWWGAGILLFLAVALLLMVGVFRYFFVVEAPPVDPQVLRAPPRIPPEPRVDPPDPGRQLRDLRSAEEARLTSYDWVDRDAGIVRIPIDRALDLLVEDQAEAEPPATQRPARDRTGGER